MDTIYIVLTVLGIGLAAMAVGTARKYHKKTRLIYLNQVCVPLFVPGVLSLSDIRILYQEKPIDTPLYFISGYFLNSGNTDIPKSSIHDPVVMQLPKTYEWLNTLIIESSPRVQAKCTRKNKSELAFEWDLLKQDEFFQFGALVKTLPSDRRGKDSKTSRNPSEVVSLSHRIVNLGNIDREEFPVFEGGKKDWLKLISSLCMTVFGVFVAIIFLISPPREVHYLVEDLNGERITISIEAPRYDELLVKGLDEEFSIRVKPNELFTKYQFINSMTRVDWPKLSGWICFLTVVVFLSGRDVIREYLSWKKKKKIKAIK